MKLIQLYIGNYRVLRSLRISFDATQSHKAGSIQEPSYALDFLVGVNGTGKSTVLRALADLFRAFERNSPISFQFELEYEIGFKGQEHKVKLSNQVPDELIEESSLASPLRIWVDGEERNQISRDLLPARIVAFTTGSEVEWENIGEIEGAGKTDSITLETLSLEERAIRELPGNLRLVQISESELSSSENRFLLIRARYLSLVTLCGLLANLAKYERLDEGQLYDVLQHAKVRNFRGFSLKFRVNQGIAKDADRESIRLLGQCATRKLRLGADYLLVFDLTGREHNLSRQIIDTFSGGLHLFEILARLATPLDDGLQILREVSLFLERSPSRSNTRQQAITVSDRDDSSALPPIHLLDWLSDGEQSFLGRMCLFMLLGETESLILLDEPEVHFNDYWKREIVHLLDGVLREHNSHILITSHSSITLTDVPREDVVILDRSGDYTSHSFNPWVQTFAADPSDIMVHVFGAPQATGAKSVARIEEALKSSPNQDPVGRREELERLLKQVSPGYWSYRIRRELSTVGVREA